MKKTDIFRDSNSQHQWLFFFAALVLYLPGIWWGLPHATSPERILGWGSDEIGPLGPVAEFYSVLIASEPTFNPQYTLLPYAIQALLVGAYLLFLLATGGLLQPGPVFPFGLTDPVQSIANMMLLARFTTLLMAAGVVTIAYRTGVILWDRIGGLLTGIIVLLMYPMFYYGRTSNVDVCALFWTALGIAIFSLCLRDRITTNRLVWLGITAGLATASKDASYAPFLMIAIILVCLHLVRQAGISRTQVQSKKPLWAGFISGAASYVLATGMWLEPSRFVEHINFVISADAAFKYPATLSGSFALLHESAGHVIASLGLPAALIGVFGLAVIAFSRPLYTLLALPALAIYVGIIMPVGFVNFRYLLVIAYILALFSAGGLAWMLEQGQRSLLRKCGIFLLVISFGWSGLRAVDLTWQMLADSRYRVAELLTMHARTGDRIGYYGASQKLPHLPVGIESVAMEAFCSWRDWNSVNAPEFILLIPVQHFEIDHEWSVPDAIYQGLQDGSLGYTRLYWVQTRSLFSKRPVPFVNPPVQVFIRSSRIESNTDQSFAVGRPEPLLASIEHSLGLEYHVPRGLIRGNEFANSCGGNALSD